ncbi:MAG: multidrug effflux MFS transporter [Hyphomicrobiales bacterium]
MTQPEKSSGPSLGEQVALVALLISIVALSIDAMLPALNIIGEDLHVAEPNDAQFVISLFFLGLAFGQMIYGPVSDSTGRKPAIYVGLLIFVAGTILSIISTGFTMMLVGRFLQGLGAAGPRIVVIALIRDLYEGRAMARIMSMIMAVFIIVPAIAPAIGQGIMMFAGWRMIFWSFLAIGLFAFFWFMFRQPETLAEENRARFSARRIWRGVVETCTNRTAFGYTIVAGLIYGAFVGYLLSAQAVFQNQYGVGEIFPLYFAVLALAIGISSIVNSKLVLKHGMRPLSRLAIICLCVLSIPFFAVAWAFAGDPPLWMLMAYFCLAFLMIGVLFGNFNALAMEPLGHIAGVAAAVIASLTTFISLAIGGSIGLAFSGTILPLVGGFALLGVASLIVMEWTERGPQTAPAE